MAKLVLDNLANLENEVTVVASINNNNDLIETAIENTLSRDGTSPNAMGSDLDMNSFNILNLPSPATENSPARLADVADLVSVTVPPVGTSGATVPLLNGNNTWSGTNDFTAATTAVTQGANDNSTKVATTAYVDAGISASSLGSIAGLSVLGVTGTSSAVPAAITGTASQFLGVNSGGTALAFQTMSGDATLSGAAITLATVNTDTGAMGSSTAIPTITTNGKGLVTAVSTNAVIAPAGTLTGTALASNVVTSDLTTTDNSVQLGGADAASPTASVLSAQGVAAGTSDTAGVTFTIEGSNSTGSASGGALIFRTTPAGGAGNAQNAYATGITITAPAVNMQPSVVIGNQALATTATDGFLYIPGGAGTPIGTPTTQTGRYPLYWDTTNKKLYIYDGSWLGGTAPGAWS